MNMANSPVFPELENLQRLPSLFLCSSRLISVSTESFVIFDTEESIICKTKSVPCSLFYKYLYYYIRFYCQGLLMSSSDPFGDKYMPGQASMHPVSMFLDDFEPCIGQDGIKRLSATINHGVCRA